MLLYHQKRKIVDLSNYDDEDEEVSEEEE